ncbi:hypothetical protein [Streptomyces sp. NBC_00105]|uniref:hypothetical protein n=1 Tax=Streptomyces sp. NBC_00105 TaxID=2903622 RepID=UPI003248DAA1
MHAVDMDLSAFDWGTVPAWVSGVGSSAALMATAHIIRRDRRDKERLDANRVACWVEWPSLDEAQLRGEREATAYVQVKNASDRPVFDVQVLLWSGRSRKPGKPHLIVAVLKATDGESEAGRELPYVADAAVPAAAAVAFRDADGCEWVRDLRTQALYRQYYRKIRKRPVDRVKARWRLVRQIGVKTLRPGYVDEFREQEPPWRRRRLGRSRR